MKDDQLACFCLENGGPVVRHLVGHVTGAQDRDELCDAAARTDSVTYWIGKIEEGLDKGTIHGGFDHCIENGLSRLLQWRMSSESIRRIDEQLLEGVESYGTDGTLEFGDFGLNVLTAYLSQAGYGTEGCVKRWQLTRLDQVLETVQRFGHDVYVDKSGFKRIPPAFASKPLINPEIIRNGYCTLPNIWDVMNFVALQSNADARGKIDPVLEYILDDRYQSFPHGFGMQFHPPGRYYATGWSVHLPRGAGALLFYLDTLGRFPRVRESDWYKSSMEFLLGCRSEDMLFQFPAEILAEKNGYFVSGARCGLGENRRRRIWRTVESSCWMLLLRHP